MPQILKENVMKTSLTPHEKMSERIGEQIVQALYLKSLSSVSHVV